MKTFHFILLLIFGLSTFASASDFNDVLLSLLNERRDGIYSDIMKRARAEDKLRRLATKEQIQEELLAVLNQPSLKKQWVNAFALTEDFGVNPDKLLPWARANLRDAMLAPAVDSELRRMMTTLFIRNGTLDDVDFLNKLADSLPGTSADSIESLRQLAAEIPDVIKTREKARAEAMKASQPTANTNPHDVQSPNVLQGNTSQINQLAVRVQSKAASEPSTTVGQNWLVWLLVVIAATAGAAWLLLLLKRK